VKAAFAEAIATCVRGWRDAFERPPYAGELVHAFEVCLAASADDYVADPVAACELFSPTRPPAKLTPAYSSKVSWRDDHLTLELVPPRYGSLSCVFEAKDQLLAIDYWVSIYPQPPTDTDCRRYLMRHAVSAWRERNPRTVVSRVRLRAIESLADPVDVELPP
jgi:hypothetical protein